jgi:hypothetical protein
MRYTIMSGIMLSSPRRARGLLKGIQKNCFDLRTMKRFAQAINIIEAQG